MLKQQLFVARWWCWMAREGFNPLVLPNKFEPSHHGFKRQGLSVVGDVVT